MIRDIAMRQYYPAQSPIHNLDPCKDCQYTVVYLISLFLFQSVPGLPGCHDFFVRLHRVVQSSGQVYPERIKADFILLLITIFI